MCHTVWFMPQLMRLIKITFTSYNKLDSVPNHDIKVMMGDLNAQNQQQPEPE